MDQLALLTPVLILIIWTFIIFLIMAFGRVSFMNNPQDAAESKDYKDKLPAWVNRTADNYNHLFEGILYERTYQIYKNNRHTSNTTQIYQKRIPKRPKTK